MHLVHHGELVALAQVAVEVDVAAEHVAQLHGDAVGDAGLVGGGEQRALHHARLHRHAGAELRAVVGHAVEVVRLGGDLDQRVASGEERQRDRLAVGADLGADVRAGAKLLQRAHLGEAYRVRAVDAKTLDERRQRVAALEKLFTEIRLRRRHCVRADREGLDDRHFRRLGCRLARRRDCERDYPADREKRDADDAAEPSVRPHEWATILENKP